MEQIKTAQLEALVERINTVTGNPVKSWERVTDASGRIRTIAQIGNYHLDWAYSGVQLVQMVNEGGGIRVITPGFGTKRECFYQMRAYLDGLTERQFVNT